MSFENVKNTKPFYFQMILKSTFDVWFDYL